ncbi:MAG: PqqD family protein [Clostridia bacterium]
MHLIAGHILRKVHKNTVLVPPPDKSIGFNGMIVLNHTGEFICKMLREETDKESLLEALAQEYSVEPHAVEKDLDAFLSELESCNMLE